MTVLTPLITGAAREDEWKGVRILRFPYLWPNRAHRLGADGAIMVSLRKKPLLWILVPFYLAGLWLATKREVARGRYRIVHSHWVVPQGVVVAAAVGAKLPHVITVHGGDVFTLKSPLLERAKGWAFRRASKVTANSSATQAEVSRITSGEVTAVVVPQGVQALRHDPAGAAQVREQLGVDSAPLLLFIGRLIEPKGVSDLLAAMPQILTQSPKAHLVIVGDGQDRHAFEDQARSLGIEGAVSFTGWLSSGALGAYMTAADVLIAPSRPGLDGWQEGQNLVIGEAMAEGTPVIATRSGGIPDYVSDRETGILVPTSSPESIAAAVAQVLTEPELAAELARAAKAQYETTLSIESACSNLVTLYRDALVAWNDRIGSPNSP